MASAKKTKPTWRDVKAELDGFDRAGLLGLIKGLHGASRDNEAFLSARSADRFDRALGSPRQINDRGLHLYSLSFTEFEHHPALAACFIS